MGRCHHFSKRYAKREQTGVGFHNLLKKDKKFFFKGGLHKREKPFMLTHVNFLS
jgi:hypothetical protein